MSKQANPGRVTKADIASTKKGEEGKEIISDYNKRVFSSKVDSVEIYCMIGKHHSLDNEYPVLYDIRHDDGQLEYAEDSVEACAKKAILNTGREKYYIKIGNGGLFYNPNGLFEGAGRNSRRTKLGRAEWNFSEVPQKAFTLYLEFLRTKNAKYLSQAQREII